MPCLAPANISQMEKKSALRAGGAVIVVHEAADPALFRSRVIDGLLINPWKSYQLEYFIVTRPRGRYIIASKTGWCWVVAVRRTSAVQLWPRAA